MTAKRKQAGPRVVALSRELRAEPNIAEHRLWHRLRSRQLGRYKFRRQHAIGRYIADFACVDAGLIIEVDGGQHAVSRESDIERTRALESQGFRVVRFWANEVRSRTDDVMREIIKELGRTYSK